MVYYIDESEIKYEKVFKGKKIKLVRCACALCEKCWFIKEAGHCIYGGPFSRFEEAKNDYLAREAEDENESKEET